MATRNLENSKKNSTHWNSGLPRIDRNAHASRPNWTGQCRTVAIGHSSEKSAGNSSAFFRRCRGMALKSWTAKEAGNRAILLILSIEKYPITSRAEKSAATVRKKQTDWLEARRLNSRQ